MLRVFIAILIAATLGGCVIWPGDYGDQGGGYDHRHDQDERGDHHRGDWNREDRR